MDLLDKRWSGFLGTERRANSSASSINSLPLVILLAALPLPASLPKSPPPAAPSATELRPVSKS